jgi:hypothetical protein
MDSSAFGYLTTATAVVWSVPASIRFDPNPTPPLHLVQNLMPKLSLERLIPSATLIAVAAAAFAALWRAGDLNLDMVSCWILALLAFLFTGAGIGCFFGRIAIGVVLSLMSAIAIWIVLYQKAFG